MKKHNLIYQLFILSIFVASGYFMFTELNWKAVLGIFLFVWANNMSKKEHG